MEHCYTAIANQYYQVHPPSYVFETRDVNGFFYIKRIVTCKAIIKIKQTLKILIKNFQK